MEEDMAPDAAEPMPMMGGAAPVEKEETPADAALVRQIQQRIKADKKHHEKAFERMKRSMYLATHGRSEKDPTEWYRVNLAGRHAKMKTAALYAKNPKVVAKRRDTLDFAVWDENPQSLQMAMQLSAMAAQATAAVPTDPMTGAPMGAPALPPGLEQATALLQDVQQGMQRRELLTKIGRTLEVLFANAMSEQKPLEFKAAAKRAVGRAVVAGVAYVELGFQRELGPRPGLDEQLSDARARLAHLQRLATDVADGEIGEDDGEMAELEASIAALQAEPEIVMREGLIFDWPSATAVIPDKCTKRLTGFVGARHITVEYSYTVEQCREIFPDFDHKRRFDGKEPNEADDLRASPNNVYSDYEEEPTVQKTDRMVTVWKHYDKPSGLVYYVADGYAEFLRPPAAPDVFVEDFWPIYPLAFNETEDEDQLFPPSDIELLESMQLEYNRARQGMREHRRAARPRFVTANGALDDTDKANLANSNAFDVIPLNLPPNAKVADILQPVPMPGVDPNLYETAMLFQDAQLAVGVQESSFGGVAKATATESAIAANSTQSSDQSSIDELDSWLSRLARGGGQILLKEMSEQQVQKIAGVGAVWPLMTLSDIAGEIYLEVAAGSTGRPNQGVEINNMERMLPYLIQLPGIDPLWLAKQVLQRLDDKLDLNEAIMQGIPSIVMQNRMAQPGPQDPNAAPDQQGAEGGDNGPKPQDQPGTDAAFGSNQV